MNEEKAKILLRLYKQDLITADEFLILCKEPLYVPHTSPNCIPTQPYINTPYYTSGTGAGDVTIATSAAPNFSTRQHSTISNSFSKKWINPEEP